jgi:nucleotide-binding universal stress UspA family protein
MTAASFLEQNMYDVYPAKSVVAAIDGSHAAVDAAVWVAHEAVDRDIPLRILYIIGERDFSPKTREAALVAAKAAYAAVKAACGQLEVEMEIVHGDVIETLVELSRSASLLSIGAPRDAADTAQAEGVAAKVVASANCSVAIIREHDPATQRRGGMIVALLDESCDDCDVLQQAMDEARLRHAPLRVVHTCVNGLAGVGSGQAPVQAAHNHEVSRPLPAWTRRYPEPPPGCVSLHEAFAEYVVRNAASIDLVVVGADRSNDIAQLVGPGSSHTLRNSGIGVLVVNHQHL